MSQILDYSWARPDLQAIKAQGYVGVLRYLSHDTTGKAITAAEAASIRSTNLGLGLVFEDRASEALSGHDAGVADAQFAGGQADSVGFPSDRPIYFAVDTSAGDSQLAAVDAYFEGVKSVLGSRTGVYGDYNLVTHYASLGYAWLWQTLAWSRGLVDNNANIYQSGASAFSGGADVDNILKADWGGWTSGIPAAPANPNPTPAPNPAQASGPGGTYTVQPGDGLIKIGASLGVDWQAIASLNHLSAPYIIQIGQVLTLPGGSSNAAPVPTTGRYTVSGGDTLSGIGAQLGVAWESIANANGIGSPYVIYPGQVLVIPGGGAPAPAARTYRVVNGDTLSGIGVRLGSDWHAIAAKNGIASPYTIYANEILQLP